MGLVSIDAVKCDITGLGVGAICFLYCPREGLIYSSFLIKGADSVSKMLAYSQDKINNDSSPFRVESVCPGSKCGGEIRDVILFTFD